MIVILLGVLLGAVLGLRFKMFALVPGMLLGLMIAGVRGIAHGDGIWHIAATMVLVVVAIQLGFLAGSVVANVANIKRCGTRRGHSVSTGISRPI
jgi:hypothetical protein